MKRIISVLLALTTMLSLFTVTAFACPENENTDTGLYEQVYYDSSNKDNPFAGTDEYLDRWEFFPENYPYCRGFIPTELFDPETYEVITTPNDILQPIIDDILSKQPEDPSKIADNMRLFTIVDYFGNVVAFTISDHIVEINYKDNEILPTTFFSVKVKTRIGNNLYKIEEFSFCKHMKSFYTFHDIPVYNITDYNYHRTATACYKNYIAPTPTVYYTDKNGNKITLPEQ